MLGPLTTVHAPDPVAGLFPESVALDVEQIVWAEEFVADVGAPLATTFTFAQAVTEQAVPVPGLYLA